MAKELIVYFSRKGNNYVNGSIKNLSVGNTEVAAKMIQDITAADMFQIEPVVEYAADYNECIEEASHHASFCISLLSNEITNPINLIMELKYYGIK